MPTDIETIFDQAAHTDRRFAISASHVIGLSEPLVMTAGTTVKNGSIAVQNDARWHIGSISKSFTSTLIMRLFERDILDLDTPVGNYLPAFCESMHPDWRAPTLRALLSHTSGLPANAPWSVTRATSTKESHDGRRTVLSAMWGQPRKHEIGTFNYSNIGYVLAGFVAEVVTESPWEDLITSQIAKPLGLTSLSFGAPREANAPRGHQSILGFKHPVAPEKRTSDNPNWMGPAGSIHLSMSELAKWGQVHMRASKGLFPSFLTKASYQTMQTPVVENYGLGWVIQTSENAISAVWHNGSNTKWYAVLQMIPEKDIAVAAATNVFARKRVDNLVRKLSAALVGD